MKQSPDDPDQWFGGDKPPHWFLLAVAAVVMVQLFIWVLQHGGF